MSQKISLKQVERKAFESAFQHGLWDIFLGCIVLEFAIAPLLSRRLGDFWSSAIFLPFWGLVYFAIWLIKKYVITPRIGTVKFGSWRKARLMRFNVVMLALNAAAFMLGIVALLNVSILPGWTHMVRFALVFLLGFSIAAYLLGITRLYFYGLLVALSPLVGEWLYANMRIPHHGFPITFGIATGIIILTGLVLFFRFLQDHPLPADEMTLGVVE